MPKTLSGWSSGRRYMATKIFRGRARMVLDLDHRYLRGVTFVGPGASKLLHSATVAVACGPIERLLHAAPSFSTISDVWLRLLEAYQE